MGTRGALGFYRDGEHKVTYNHFDSYPEGLGNDILEFIKGHSGDYHNLIRKLNKIFDRIKMVSEGSMPTPEQIKICRKYADLDVSKESLQTWYSLLRKAQGDLNAYADVGFMINNYEFLYDGLFCEWAYIINLDTNVLEVYNSFGSKGDAKGRYIDLHPSLHPTNYVIGLIAEIPLENCISIEKFTCDSFRPQDEE